MANPSEGRLEVLVRRELREATSVRSMADQAFSRAAGAPLISGNRVRMLKDAAENYPAWLEAIGQARRHIHFESYILHEDTVGRQFAEALISRARAGVRVRLIYDWLGGLGKTSPEFWSRLREGGVEVRCFNPPHLDAPLGWLSRDHRKMLSVDGEVGFVTGLCVGQMWVGDPARGRAPWRDTGVEIRGPALAEIERAFANVWAMTGDPIPEEETLVVPLAGPAGTVSLRIVASAPATSGMFRLDQMVTALARHRVWLSDAYYAGAAPYVQALRAAAKEGVDVRLLVPNATDIPLLQPLSRAGYRPLLEAGIRIFEWNGSMMHAKTAVVDGRWARVGSTNLNLASWLGNCEMDAVIEDQPFAQLMEAQYLEDLAGSTEIVLSERRRLQRPRRPTDGASASGGAGAVRAAAGAVRIGHALGAAFTNHRVLEPVEARLMVMTGLLLLGLTALFVVLPWLLIYPVLVVLGWAALAFLYRGIRLYRQGKRSAERP